MPYRDWTSRMFHRIVEKIPLIQTRKTRFIYDVGVLDQKTAEASPSLNPFRINYRHRASCWGVANVRRKRLMLSKHSGSLIVVTGARMNGRRPSWSRQQFNVQINNSDCCQPSHTRSSRSNVSARSSIHSPTRRCLTQIIIQLIF